MKIGFKAPFQKSIWKLKLCLSKPFEKEVIFGM
jgi:hypothetical protein